MTEEMIGAGVPGGVLWLFPPRPDAVEQQGALTDWARENGLDPARVIGTDGVAVDLVGRVIHYAEKVDPGTPGAEPPGRNGVWKRRRATPLLVEPPAALRLPPVGWNRVMSVNVPPAPAYDWTRYERTCDPDRQLDGLGDLCLFLGGTWSESPRSASFTGVLLMLIEKGQSTPERFHQLAAAFPREVTAWLVWRHASPTPTAAELCAALIANDNRREALRALADATPLDVAVVLDEGPEAGRWRP